MGYMLHVAVALLLVVHLTVGCCAHHGHACNDQTLPAPHGVTDAADDSCPCSHESPDEAHHSHHGPGDCQGSVCSAVLSSATGSGKSGESVQVSFAITWVDMRSSLRPACEQHPVPGGWPPLAVRLHLLHHVLLI